MFTRHVTIMLTAAACGSRTGLDRPDIELDAASQSACDPSVHEPVTILDIRGRYDLPSGLAADATDLYYGGLGAIVRLAKTGSQPVWIAGAGSVDEVQVDEGQVYWSSNGAILRASKSDKYPAAGMLVSQRGNGGPAGFIVEGSSVYFGDTGGMAIWRASKEGDPATLFAANQSHVQRIVSDGTIIFWTRGFSGAPTWEGGVAAASIAGGSVRTLATGWYAEGVGIDDANVYFAARRPDGGRIMRVPKEGGDVTELAVATTPRALAVRGGSIYWTDATGGTINRTPTTGGKTDVIGAAEGTVEEIAVDDACVYWTTIEFPQTGRPAIRRAPR